MSDEDEPIAAPWLYVTDDGVGLVAEEGVSPPKKFPLLLDPGVLDDLPSASITIEGYWDEWP